MGIETTSIIMISTKISNYFYKKPADIEEMEGGEGVIKRLLPAFRSICSEYFLEIKGFFVNETRHIS